MYNEGTSAALLSIWNDDLSVVLSREIMVLHAQEMVTTSAPTSYIPATAARSASMPISLSPGVCCCFETSPTFCSPTRRMALMQVSSHWKG